MSKENSSQKKKNKKKSTNSFIRYSDIAFRMAFIIFAGVFGGYKADKYFNFEFPVFTLILSLLSVAAAIYIIIKDFLK